MPRFREPTCESALSWFRPESAEFSKASLSQENAQKINLVHLGWVWVWLRIWWLPQASLRFSGAFGWVSPQGFAHLRLFIFSKKDYKKPK